MSVSDEQVERAARALWDAYRDRIPANAEIPVWNGEMMTEYTRDIYREYARAALEAAGMGNGYREGMEAAAKIAADFSWQLPMYESASDNEVSDDAACAVMGQIAAAIRSAGESGG